MKDVRCRMGRHDFPWIPHTAPPPETGRQERWLRCARGCGERTIRVCFAAEHGMPGHPDYFDGRPPEDRPVRPVRSSGRALGRDDDTIVEAVAWQDGTITLRRVR